MLAGLATDLRQGARTLRRHPGFTALVVLTLGLGIGANTAIFSLLDAVLLRPLPLRDPGQLVTLSQGLSAGVWGEPTRLLDLHSYPLYQRLRAQGRPFAGLAAQQSGFTRAVVRWRDGEPPAEVAAARAVSGNFFEVLGVPASRGRTFASTDDAPGAAAVVVLSHGYWQRRFGGDPAVLGARLTINATAYTVVGIAAPAFTGTAVGDETDLWVPLAMQPALAGDESLLPKRTHYWLYLFGRLVPGTDAATAQAAVNVTLRQFLAEDRFRISDLPVDEPTVAPTAKDVRIEVAPGGRGLEGVRRWYRQPLLALMTGVGLLLLIVCLNVGHLLLVRALRRQRELGIRVALGASREQLMRQLLAEGLLLALAGGAAGALATGWLTDLLLALAPARASVTVHPELTVWAFGSAVTLGLALLLGLIPAWQATRGPLPEALRVTASALADGRSPRWLRRGLLVSQVALSIVLLIGAGLLAGSLGRLRRVDTGLDEEHLLVAQVLPREMGLSDGEAPALYDRLLGRIGALPGVRDASLSALAGMWMLVLPSGRTTPTSVQRVIVTPEHFQTVGLAGLRGRTFTGQDHGNTPAVAVVNRTLARQLFGGGEAVGRHFRLVAEPRTDLQVVGVVSDARILDRRDQPPPAFYRPVAQDPEPLRRIEVRAHGDPTLLIESVRRAIAEVAPALPVLSVRTMRAQVERGLEKERLLSTLSSAFGVVALFLVALGLYGVVAQWTAQRTAEIGVRMALGASAGRVRWMVLRQAFALVAAGAALGIPAALAAARLLAELLYGVRPTDPATLVGATAAMFAVAALAAYLPARRASRVDPMTALRCE